MNPLRQLFRKLLCYLFRDDYYDYLLRNNYVDYLLDLILLLSNIYLVLAIWYSLFGKTDNSPLLDTTITHLLSF